MTERNGSDLEPAVELVVRHDGDTSATIRAVVNRAGPDLAGELTRKLVDALADVQVLEATEGRGLFHRLLKQRVQGLAVIDQAYPRMFFADVVDRCSRQPGALSDLAACVELLAGGDPMCQEAWRRVEQLEALKIVPELERSWYQLAEALKSVPLMRVNSLIRQITDGRVGVLPAHCDETFSAFAHLVGQNGSADNPIPPWVAFLEIVRRELDEEIGRQVRDLVRALARKWECTAELERVQGRYDGQNPRPTKTGVLTIVISPDRMDPEAFTLHSFERWDDDFSAPVSGNDLPVRRDELTARVEELVLRTEENWASFSADLAIEFVLPVSLINAPVEWWPKDSSTPPPTSLALYHTVVVRSFDRLRRTSWHRVWHRRWERLQGPRPAEALWARDPSLRDPSREDHVHRLEAELRSREDYVALVLSEQPGTDPESAQELMVALRAGVPLILWHREGNDSEQFRTEVALLLEDLRNVPEAVTQLRRRIESLGPAERSTHAARELSVLWDDAVRAPSTTRTGFVQ